MSLIPKPKITRKQRRARIAAIVRKLEEHARAAATKKP